MLNLESSGVKDYIFLRVIMKSTGTNISILISFLFVLIVFGINGPLIAQSVREMDKRAEEHYKKKEFNKAVALWLNILDIEPENMVVQRKIESIYEEKQRKDFSIQKAKLNFKIARKTLELNRHSEELTDEDIEKNLKLIIRRAKSAFASFIIAYRIDPADPELQELRLRMAELEKEVKAEEARGKLSLTTRKKLRALKDLANKKMDEKKFDDAVKDWVAVLAIVPLDVEAQEGKRKCTLAIENRIRYEKIKRFLEQGRMLYAAKKYKPSKTEFTQVLTIDPENREAEDYLEKIAEKLEEQRMREVTRIQTEDFYLSGIRNLRRNSFDLAIEDFESALALIPDYKDTRARLRSVSRLRDEYLRKRRQEDLRSIDREFQNGMVSLSEGKYREAISAFALTLSLDPSNEQAKKYMQRARDAQRAVAEEVVDENSPYYEIVSSLIIAGETLFEQGKYNESKKKWDNILSLFPKNRIASEYMLKCEYKLNPDRYREFVKSIVSDGDKFLKQKKYRDALRKFELIKSINPDSVVEIEAIKLS